MSEVVEPPSNQKSIWRPVYGSFLFAIAYVIAVYLGRMTVIDGENLNLAWPAAGVMALWFTGHRGSKLLILDVVLSSIAAVVLDSATGTSLPLAGAFVVANLVQTISFMWLFARLCAGIDVGGGTKRLGRVNELFALIICAGVASTLGAAIGPTAVWAEFGFWDFESASVWMARNAVSIVLLGSLGVGIAYWSRERGAIVITSKRAIELALIVTISAIADALVFTTASHLPLAFLLLLGPMSIGVRFNTTVTAAYNFAFSTAIVILTVNGVGPFRWVENNVTLALITQALLVMVVLLSLGIALTRGQQNALLNEVRKSRAASEAQAKRLETIIESMTEGLAVVDASGRIVMRNLAGKELLGGVRSESGTVAQPDYYGLFDLEGNPVKAENLGYYKALAGTEVRNEYLVVRNAGVPEGRVLSVNAVPLPGDAGGAVVIFRDVTEERRKHDDLTAFAGVVAHDLMAPLASVRGWSEVLEDSIDDLETDEGSKQQLVNSVIRIQSASSRMSALIEDLLSFATAENSSVAPSTFDLAQLVNEVVHSRMDSFAPGDDNHAQLPIVTVEDLGLVYGDTALVRQLFDNLIGNAIKYTAPEVRPEITVSADRAEGNRVRILISDNGIGIPEGQHAKIFDEFHRAHRNSDYAGTGIGLSVCKRIVERHGGTIEAVNNPGGGSIFVFSLPSPPKGERPALSTIENDSDAIIR